MPRSTQSFRPCSNGSSMPSPTDSPPASWQPRFAASIDAGPAAGDHGEARLGQRGAELPAERVLAVVARWCGPSRTPSPRGAARRACRSPRRTRPGCAAPATGRCAPSRWARASRAAAGRWCSTRCAARGAAPPGRAASRCSARGRRRSRRSCRHSSEVVTAVGDAQVSGRVIGSARACAPGASHERKRRSTSVLRVIRCRVDVLLPRVREVRVARAVVDAPGCRARRSARRRSSRTSPARSSRWRARNSACGRGVEPGQRTGRGVGHRHVQPGEHLADVLLGGLSTLRSGANRKLTVTTHSSGTTLPATPPMIRTACRPSRYSQPSISTRRGLVGGEPVEHLGRPGGSRCRRATIGPSARGGR